MGMAVNELFRLLWVAPAASDAAINPSRCGPVTLCEPTRDPPVCAAGAALSGQAYGLQVKKPAVDACKSAELAKLKACHTYSACRWAGEGRRHAASRAPSN